MPNESHYREVQDSARRHGGECVVRFSQALPPFRSMIGSDPKTRDGICAALNAYWIVRSHAGQSLWTWLFDRDGLNSAAVGELMTKQSNWGVIPKGGVSDWVGGRPAKDSDSGWGAGTNDYLSSHGIRHTSPAAWDGGSATGVSELTHGISLGQHYSDLVLRKAPPNPAYFAWSMLRAGAGGHSVSGRLSGSPVFFDPNYGQFRFDSPGNFAQWIKEVLFKVTWYPDELKRAAHEWFD